LQSGFLAGNIERFEGRNPKRTGEDCHAKRKIGAKTPLKRKQKNNSPTKTAKLQKKSAQNTHKKDTKVRLPNRVKVDKCFVFNKNATNSKPR